MDNKQTRYLEDITYNMQVYFRIHPHKTFIILHRDALYYTFTNHSENPHQAYIEFHGLTKGIYPNYEQDVAKYISQKQPLILMSLENKLPRGYQTVKSWPGFATRLVAPIDIQ